MDKPSIIYASRPDTNSEMELSALAAVYRIVLGVEKKATPESRPVDGTKARRIRQ